MVASSCGLGTTIIHTLHQIRVICLLVDRYRTLCCSLPPRIRPVSLARLTSDLHLVLRLLMSRLNPLPLRVKFNLADLPLCTNHFRLQLSYPLLSLINVAFDHLEHLTQLLHLDGLICDSELQLLNLIVHVCDRALLCLYLLALDLA